MYKGKRTNNRYTVDFKKKVVKDYFDGAGGTILLSRKYGIPSKTIEHWIEKVNKNIDLAIDSRGKNSKSRGRLKQRI